ncbi:hypothetical protein [Aestuariivivens sp. NBU2969]|uniref:hypothetical protein n=1 Tax=Aestuariivivens sp. NBU2969 TaxID=2873267 RepID=UPI001CBA9E09|nr:hypothetical protein [Aestuariivivens sp. NBU2969]
MNYTFLLAITLFMFSCGNKKVIQLPEIDHAEITEISDVSATYLFYDETQPDSVSLNRKNLISTTNWLVNVDKRLTLKQVIPHIQFLQEKKRNAGHKNPNAKNYFSCHDTSNNNLGFVEFTDVIYIDSLNSKIKNEKDSLNINTSIFFDSLKSISINEISDYIAVKRTINLNQLLNEYKGLDFYIYKDSINISFNKKMSFQVYITIKKFIESIKQEGVKVSNKELISN